MQNHVDSVPGKELTHRFEPGLQARGQSFELNAMFVNAAKSGKLLNLITDMDQNINKYRTS